MTRANRSEGAQQPDAANPETAQAACTALATRII